MVGLVEVEHVERIAHAIQVAAVATKRQRGVGRLVGVCRATLGAARHGNDPQRTPFIRGPSQRVEQSRGSHRIAHRLFKVGPVPELRFSEPKQAHRFEGDLFAPARRLERGGGGGDRRLEFALAHLYQREAVARLRFECGCSRALRQVDHLGRIGAGALNVALGDEAFRALVEQL
ncbi:MAG: hypothetical protein E6H64_13795 [Betaproteobacteria bacterium]|nr:MAG: hypothetical protein E6H64_13795 [Betaproteobacteria bacterium]